MKDDRVYLSHIRDAIARVNAFTAEGRDHFLRDPMVQNAVIRNREVIGDAAKGL